MTHLMLVMGHPQMSIPALTYEDNIIQKLQLQFTKSEVRVKSILVP